MSVDIFKAKTVIKESMRNRMRTISMAEYSIKYAQSHEAVEHQLAIIEKANQDLVTYQTALEVLG